jgi:hypothetical protein
MLLHLYTHGLDGQLIDSRKGLDNTVIQYADSGGQVFRRIVSPTRLSEYGGWRWECSLEHWRRFLNPEKRA